MLDSNVIVGFDTETTGIDPHSARVVTCSCIRQENGKMTELYWILDPEVEIPEGASDVHCDLGLDELPLEGWLDYAVEDGDDDVYGEGLD